MSNGSRNDAMDRTGLRQALARYSETSIFAVRKLLSGENPSARSGSFKRAAAEVLGPYRQCYQPVNVPNVEADRPDVTFYMADFKKKSLSACAALRVLLATSATAGCAGSAA